MATINKSLDLLGKRFAALRPREQILVTAAGVVALALAGNVVLLRPVLAEIEKFKNLERAHQTELAAFSKILVEIQDEAKNRVDPFAGERAQIAALKAQIAEVDAFLGQNDSGASQEGDLVRALSRPIAGLIVVSVKTLPGALFYTPPAAPAPREGAGGEVEKALSKFKKKESQETGVALVRKPIYKHGFEIRVQGSYPVLMAYLENLQKFPRRIFWSEAQLDANNFREAGLRLVIYTLGDQMTTVWN